MFLDWISSADYVDRLLMLVSQWLARKTASGLLSFGQGDEKTRMTMSHLAITPCSPQSFLLKR